MRRDRAKVFLLLQLSDTSSARKFYIESYGCAMNFADSEVVASILQGAGFSGTRDFKEADLVLINTCSIREKAEQTIRSRLHIFPPGQKI